jgi:hypothetical protein
MQQIEKDRTADAEAEGGWMQVAIGQIENPDSPLVLAQHPVDPGTCRQGVLLETERPQNRQAGGLQQKAGTHGMRLLETFQNGNTMSGIGEESRSGLTGDAAAHDSDLKRTQRHPTLF